MQICMKCQILFSGKNKKNIINLSFTGLSQRVVKLKPNQISFNVFISQVSAVTSDAVSTVTVSVTSNLITDITSNAAEATTHVFETYNYFVHPHWYNFPVVSAEWHYLVGVYITLVGFTGIFGNALVIYIFSR